MVVQHNLTAMNSNRMLGVVTGQQAKSSEKLSSGYKINRAADDAAGLSISEKMRKQINGLDRASSNAEDGVSAVQTAEGALTEVHSMLQRMNELAVQASNGTNSEDDREAIQSEIDQLVTEIDRVAETTKFNESYLLKGAADGATEDKFVAAHDAGIKGVLTDNGDGTSTFKIDALKVDDKISINGKEYTIVDSADPADYKSIVNYKAASGDVITDAEGNKYTYYAEGDTDAKGVAVGTGKAGWYQDGDSTQTAAIATDIVKAGNLLNGQEMVGAVNNYTLTNDYTTPANGDKITTADNQVFTYRTTAGTHTGGAGGTAAANGWYKDDKALAKGDTFTDVHGNTYTYDDGTTKVNNVAISAGWYINGEFSDKTGTKRNPDKTSIAITDIANGGTLTKGTSSTVLSDSSKEYTLSTIDTVKTDIKALSIGDTVTIGDADGSNQKTYTISAATDNNTNYTADDLALLLKGGETVKIQKAPTPVTNTTTATNIPAPVYHYTLPADSEKDTEISKAEAYDMIANALKDASNIGTDANAQASVKSNDDGTFTITQGKVKVAKDLSFSLHVGADADMTNKINIDIEAMSAAGLGIKGINVKDSTGIAATLAIDVIADAVSKVSSQRSTLGAVQNRLEHTIDNLDNVVENTTSAESRIRDTDMAEEMVEYTKNNILAQAGQSMLAQANQSTQGVLSLLS